MLASRDPVGDAGAAQWSYRAPGGRKVAAGRQPHVAAGSRQRPSRLCATPATARQDKRPARRTAPCRFASDTPASPVANQTQFGTSPR
jgi:hypothetical protein